MEASDVYQCPGHVKQVVRLLRVIVCPAPSAMPLVDISISGISLPTSVIRSWLRACSRLPFIRRVSQMTYSECFDEVKVNLPVGHQFPARTSFDAYADVTRHAWGDIFESPFRCYTAYYSGQIEEWRSRMLSGPSSRVGFSGADTISLTWVWAWAGYYNFVSTEEEKKS